MIESEKMVHHHTKYKEIHGVDEVVIMPLKEHQRLHRRLRREGKCKIPSNELNKISQEARKRLVESGNSNDLPDVIREPHTAFHGKYYISKTGVVSITISNVLSKEIPFNNCEELIVQYDENRGLLIMKAAKRIVL